MDNAAARQAIADALGTVDRVRGYPRRPAVVKAGDGWPIWRGAARSDGYLFVQTFAVIVALPSGEVDADRFVDQYGEDLANALESVLFVDSFTPSVVASDAGDLLALTITGRSE